MAYHERNPIGNFRTWSKNHQFKQQISQLRVKIYSSQIQAVASTLKFSSTHIIEPDIKEQVMKNMKTLLKVAKVHFCLV